MRYLVVAVAALALATRAAGRLADTPLARACPGQSIGIIRARTGDPNVPIHVVGGISKRTGAAEARGFMRAVRGCRTLGFSLYAFFGTTAAAWRALTTPAVADDTPACA